MPRTPVQDAETVLRRNASFRRLGFGELQALALASSDTSYTEVIALLRKGCPKKLVVRILT